LFEMKKIVFAALVAASALGATPALAQSASGTIGVTGSVGAKCTASTEIAGTIALGELSRASGTVDSAFSNAAGGLSRSYTVKCTSATPHIAVDATPLTTTSSGAAGYTGTVHYTATVTANKAGGGSESVAHITNAAAPAVKAVGARLANAENNITVGVASGFTATAGDLLEAGNYSASIKVTVSPAA
jgi:hypothetical protein